jgi:hypothetical protein
MYSPAFYAACTAGGVASCGLTHMTVTPLDLVKCNMQVSVLDAGSIWTDELLMRGFPFRLVGLFVMRSLSLSLKLCDLYF